MTTDDPACSPSVKKMTMRCLSGTASDALDQIAVISEFARMLHAWADRTPKTHRPVARPCLVEDFFPDNKHGQDTISEISRMLSAIRFAGEIAGELMADVMRPSLGPMFWKDAMIDHLGANAVRNDIDLREFMNQNGDDRVG